MSGPDARKLDEEKRLIAVVYGKKESDAPMKRRTGEAFNRSSPLLSSG